MQERNFGIVLDVLMRFKAADVEKAVKTLTNEQVDVLMKYIYRGFANPTENSCGILLSWHDKVSLTRWRRHWRTPPSLPPSMQAVAAGGLGSIVRVMTDRKAV